MKLLNTLLTLSLAAITSQVMAANTLTSLKVQNDIVYFATEGTKTETSPSCMAAENSSKWTLSLNSASGKAMYALLVTASADSREVTVETANDCADQLGYERAASIEIGKAEMKTSGGSEFVPTFFSGAKVVAAGVQGDFIVLTPPEGQRVRLNALGPHSSGEPGISILVGGRPVISSLKLDYVLRVEGSFSVVQAVPSRYAEMGAIPYIQGNIGESIVVRKDSGKTGTQINYSFSYSY